MTEEKLIHSMISDVFRITNEASSTKSKTPSYSSSKELPKTFLYEFCKDGKLFNVEDLDVVLYTRLSKQKEENKFKYLFGAYEEMERNIVAKRKNSVEQVKEIKNIICRYFVTCFSVPDTFELHNPYAQVGDGNPASLN
jgi:hypothetical protein